MNRVECVTRQHKLFNAGRINIVAERATTHFRKPEVVRMQAHSANSLDDRLDSSCKGGSVDNASHSSRSVK